MPNILIILQLHNYYIITRKKLYNKKNHGFFYFLLHIKKIKRKSTTIQFHFFKWIDDCLSDIGKAFSDMVSNSGKDAFFVVFFDRFFLFLSFFPFILFDSVQLYFMDSFQLYPQLKRGCVLWFIPSAVPGPGQTAETLTVLPAGRYVAVNAANVFRNTLTATVRLPFG